MIVAFDRRLDEELREQGIIPIKLKVRGSFCDIYKGERWVFDRREPVAVKTLNKQVVTLKDFADECRILPLLQHKNIVRHILSSETSEAFIIVSEYLQRGNLQSLIQHKDVEIPEQQVQVWANEIASALIYMKRQGFAYRNLILQNLLLADDFSVKLSDFGLALEYDGTLCKDFRGTSMYCPPEVVSRQPYDTFLADVWALGVVIYYLMTKTPPFVLPTAEFASKTIYQQQILGVENLTDSLPMECKLLLRGIFTVDFRRRPTIEDVTSQCWMTGNKKDSKD